MVALAVTGGSYPEVADILKVKAQTVKNHARAARRKYDVTTNVAFFVKVGWLRVTGEYPYPILTSDVP